MAWDRTPVSNSLRDEAQRMLVHLLRCPLADRLRQATELGREVPILYRPRPGVAVDGKIDLLFQEADGAVAVLDYKTDDVLPGGEEALAVAHLPQLELYALAVREAAEIMPGRLVIHFLKTGQSVEYEVDEPMLERAKERVLAIVGELSQR
jgi:ATP-dependent exoDNAse (exonuclease V) beta subunit